MAAPCRFMLLPAELRMNVYRKVFHDFILEIVDESNFAAYSGHPDNDGQSDIPTNQLCRTSRQIRLESIPVLASCTKVIVAPILLPYKDGHIDTSIKPQLVYPKLNKAFRSNIQAIFVSLQSAWIPHHRDYSNLRRVVVDAWLSGEEPIKVVKDKDLSKMASRDLVGYGGSEDIHPRWLEELVEEKSSSVKLALRQVWKLDEDTSDSSHLKALVNVTDGTIEERHLGSKIFEEVDIDPPAWLFG